MSSAQRFTRIALELSLTVASPFLFRGLPGKLFGLDASALRDEQGRPIIPADQIRGCLRDAFEDLAAAGVDLNVTDILDLFGRPSADADPEQGANKPERGRLIVSDLTARALDGSRRFETTRVSIDDDTGAAEEAMMQVLELVAPFDANVVFEGTATLFVPVGTETIWQSRLERAINLITAIGAIKTSGYGEVVATSVKCNEALAITVPAAAASGAVRRRYRATFDRPILVDAEWIADNAMAGRAVLPGAVFKGALAQALIYAGEDPERGDYSAALSAISIGHAFPEIGNSGKPGSLPLPLSLVSANGEDFDDALLCPAGQGAMMPGQPGVLKPALFTSDWKPAWFDRAAALMGYRDCDPPLLSRTHTAIGHDGVATDRALFTTLSRGARVRDKDGVWHDRGWILDVACDGSARAMSLLALLERGLDGIGKTGAHVQFNACGDSPDEPPREIVGRPGEYAVMLVTPAHLLDTRLLVAETDGVPTWRVTAQQAYEAYWRNAVPGAKLESFFASQAYTGGYLSRRHRAFGAGHYHPFLITEAGSIFRLSQVSGEALTQLQKLCRSGLPPSTIDGKSADWTNCPYVPENGYGRIKADHLSAAGGTAWPGAVRYA